MRSTAVRATLLVDQAGSALAEMAILLPFFMAILLGTIDFGRVFYAGIAVTQAARAGVQYGVQNPNMGQATLYFKMQAAATNAAAGYPGISIPTPVPQRYCQCAGVTASCTSNCGDGTAPQLYVQMTIPSYQFNTFTNGVFGIPATVTLTRTAVMRVR